MESGVELLAEFGAKAKSTGIVFLGELDTCHWMLQTQPFPWKARFLKETEIYELKKARYQPVWDRKYLRTNTPRNYNLAASYPLRSMPSPAPSHLGRPNFKEREMNYSKKGQETQASITDILSLPTPPPEGMLGRKLPPIAHLLSSFISETIQ